MGEFLQYFKSKKNLMTLVLIGILLLAIPVGITLLKQQQVIKSRATGDEIRFSGANVKCTGGNCITTSPDVQIELTSPVWPTPSGGTQ